MPEGPELHLASRFVTDIGRKYIFNGKVEKSAVSTKNPDVDWDARSYVISAQSRGKEVKLTLTEWENRDDKSKLNVETKPKCMDILFRFGMSGKFTFTKCDEKPKHAHLNFFTAKDNMVLSFVDYRRFGRWEVDGNWSTGRGPCVIQEYTEFRNHVLKNVHSSVFKKPICEVMLNQAYFNGIGNYLRAEILYRLGIPPFVSAESVLEKLVTDNPDEEKKVKVKSEGADFLQLCNLVPLEVVNLDGTGYDPDTGTGDLTDFTMWLRCYYNTDMKNMVDHNGRTIWFCGEAGPLKPKDSKSRGIKTKTKKVKAAKDETDAVFEDAVVSRPKKKRGRATIKSPSSDVKPKTTTRKSRKAVGSVKGRLTRGKLNEVKENGNLPQFSQKQNRSKLKEPRTPKVARSNRQLKTPQVKLTPRVPAKRLSKSTGTPGSPRVTRRSARVKSQQVYGQIICVKQKVSP
ncbi:endonuclease 8-like 1 [Liolophura sinensis]|uniref:endonuclease 8-like 1 n=1 Tax=Liolophura sinensis TaxID=3198878 RepID=UPI0031587779